MQPTVVTYSALMAACASAPGALQRRRRRGQNRALRQEKAHLLQLALRTHQHMVFCGVSPSVITLSTLANVCEKCKGVDRIFPVLARVDFATLPSVVHRFRGIPATEVLGAVCRALASGKKEHRQLLQIVRQHFKEKIFCS